jgi:hypothetical protein
VVDGQLSGHNQVPKETKQERRERRRAKDKARMAQHGKSLSKVYKDAVSKRTKTKKSGKQSD